MSDLKFGTALKPLSRFSQFGMSDITMLLLMFFLLTSNFASQNGIPVNIPKAEAGEPSTDNAYLTVTITDKDAFYVNDTPVSADSLVQAIVKVKGDKTKVVIRADENAHHGAAMEAASAAASLSLKIAFATEPMTEENTSK